MEEVRNYGKIVYIKNILKWLMGGCTPLIVPLAISYKNFSHLAQLILFFFTKKRSEKGGVMAPLNTLLSLRTDP